MRGVGQLFELGYLRFAKFAIKDHILLELLGLTHETCPQSKVEEVFKFGIVSKPDLCQPQCEKHLMLLQESLADNSIDMEEELLSYYFKALLRFVLWNLLESFVGAKNRKDEVHEVL